MSVGIIFESSLIFLEWGPTYVIDGSNPNFVVVTSFIPGEKGYTVRSVDLDYYFSENDTYYVAGDPVPNVALLAYDLNQQLTGVVEGNVYENSVNFQTDRFIQVMEKQDSINYLRLVTNFNKRIGI